MTVNTLANFPKTLTITGLYEAKEFFSRTSYECVGKYCNFSNKVTESYFQNIQHILVVMCDI